jgi:hypothetical protein
LIPLIAGVLLAVAVAALAKVTRFEQERGFYPTVLIIITSYYVLFAILGGSSHALVWESVVAFAFSAIAIFGSLRSPLLVGAAIAAHGLFDLVHHVIIQNPGVPSWWPIFCSSIDVPLGLWVMSLWHSRRNELLKTSSGG